MWSLTHRYSYNKQAQEDIKNKQTANVSNNKGRSNHQNNIEL